jgi:phage terminase small subunit
VLTLKQQRFIHFYIACANGTRAAIQAGYSEKTARSIASENLKKPAIRKEIEQRRDVLRRETDRMFLRLAQEWAHIAFASLGDLYRDDGSVKSLEELDPETRAAIKKVCKPKKVRPREKGWFSPYKLHDKMTALDRLSQHMGYSEPRAGRPPGPARRKGQSGGITVVIPHPKGEPPIIPEMKVTTKSSDIQNEGQYPSIETSIARRRSLCSRLE